MSQIERILDVNYPVDEPIQAYGKLTPLMFCADVGESDSLKLFLSRNADVKAVDRSGRTVLHHCCKGGNVQNLQVLMTRKDCRALMETRTGGGLTPLHYAVQKGNIYFI